MNAASQEVEVTIEIQPIGIEAAEAIPLPELPLWIRRTADQKAAVNYEWSVAFHAYKQRQCAKIHHLHCEAGFGIKAAEIQAEIDPEVRAIGEHSRQLKERLTSFEISERHLLQLYEVKLALLRSSLVAVDSHAHARTRRRVAR